MNPLANHAPYDPRYNMAPGTSAFDIEDQTEREEAEFWERLNHPGKPSEEDMER